MCLSSLPIYSGFACATQDNPFASEEITPPFSDEWAAKRRVADAIKQLTEVLVTSSPDIEKMHAIAEQLEVTAADFRKSPRIFGRSDWAASGEHGSFGQVSHELKPLAGWSNPIAPPVNSWIDGDLARATASVAGPTKGRLGVCMVASWLLFLISSLAWPRRWAASPA